jgi:hypothetical protein
LLGRGAQRERRDSNLTIDTKLEADDPNGKHVEIITADSGLATSSPVPIDGRTRAFPTPENNGGGLASIALGTSSLRPRPSMDGYTIRSDTSTSDPDTTPTTAQAPTVDTSPSFNYSTTDDEDALHMARSSTTANPILRPATSSLSSSSAAAASLLRPDRASSLSSGSESCFLTAAPGNGSSNAIDAHPSLHRRRSTVQVQHAKSPLALTSLATPLPQPDAEWDYAETEWWGWIILAVTWTVFVIGMGSCLGVWSWAWDVGTTPYAPPELEDDPTLPIVGYYPALIILTGVMAWVWVLVAWVGMKYFRHAQVSGN